MSRRPKGGAGGRKKVGKQEPLVSEAWGTLASTTISLLETVGAINEDAADDCIEEAAQLGEMNKKRMGFQARMQLLDAVTQMIEGFLGAFADLSDEQREEHGVAEIFENLYGSMFTIISESIEGIDKDGVSAKQSEELQQQIALTLRLIDVLIAVSFENDEESALVYFKPFISVLFELCCTQLCLGGDKYDFFVRQMALGLMTELIESRHLNPLLADPEHKNLVELIINTCFTLCADEKDAKKEEGGAEVEQKKSAKKSGGDDEDEEDEEEEESKSLDPNEETSQNLGTQLLDTLTDSLHAESTPDESIAAPLILAKSQGILADAASSKLDRKAALVCLAVLPEAATSFSKKPENLASVMALIQKFMAAGEEALVRSGAFIALSEHLEHLQPEIAPFHEAVLTTILSVLADPLDKSNFLVKIKACIPLQQLASQESLPLKFLQADSPDNLFKILLAQVKAVAAKDGAARSEDEQELLQSLLTSVGNMSSTYAVQIKRATPPAAGKYLESLVAEAFELLLTVAESSTTEGAWGVRGEASSALGQLCQSLDKAAVLAAMPRLSQLLQASMNLAPEDAEESDALPSSLYDLRGSTHATWSGLAQKLGEDVLPYVESIIPGLVRCLAAEYAAVDDEEQPEEEDEEDPQMPSGGDDDKAAPNNERQFALECYQHLLQALGPKFAPFQTRCFDVIAENAKTYPIEVQLQLVYVLSAMTQLYPLPAGVALVAGVDAAVSEDARTMLKNVKALLFDYVQHVTDPEVVEAALDALTAIANTYGQVFINDSPDSITTVQKFANKLLKRSAPCQTLDPREVPYFDPSDMFGGFGQGDEDGEDGEEHDEEEEEEEEEEAEHEHGENCNHGPTEEADDAGLFESLFNMLGSIVKAKGPAFKPTIELLFPQIVKLGKKPAYAGSVTGFFADLADGFGDEVFPVFSKDIMPVLMADINSKEDNTLVWRNSAFALGSIFFKCALPLTQEFLVPAATGLQAILAQLEVKLAALPKDSPSADDVLGCRDNVISALGKMLMIGSAQLPVAQLTPLFVAGLPLANDFAESQGAYTAAVKLINTFPAAHPGVLEPLFPALLKAFATVIVQQGDEQKVSEQLKQFMLKGARTMIAAQPALRADVVDKLDFSAAFIAKLDAAEQ